MIPTTTSPQNTRNNTAFPRPEPNPIPLSANVSVTEESKRNTPSPSESPDLISIVQTDQRKPIPVVTKPHNSVPLYDSPKQQEYERYKRTTSPKPTDSSSSSGGEDIDRGSMVIVGGRNRTHFVPGADVKVSVLARKAQEIVEGVCGALTVAMTALLVFCHMVALYSPTWLPSRRNSRIANQHTWLSPNTWELLVVYTYFQHVGSISMMDLTKAPNFVVDFTDSFAWTNFNVASRGSGVTRRLEYLILMGMVAYADRLGLEEGKLLAYTTRAFFAAVGIVVGCFFLAILLQQCRDKLRPTITDATHPFGLCILGLGTVLWMVGILPLSATSSYELRMQLQFSLNSDLSVIVFNLVVVVLGGLILLLHRVQLVQPDDAMDYRHVAVFGTLYADVKRNARFFFAVFSLFQTALGLSVGAIEDGPNQVVAQLILHGAFAVVLVAVRPYHQPAVNIFVGAVTAFRVVNLLLANSFVAVNAMSLERRGVQAKVFVFANFVFVLSIFFRQVLVVIYVWRVWSSSKPTIVRSTVMVDDENQEVTQGTRSRIITCGSDAVVIVTPSSSVRSLEWKSIRSTDTVESRVPNLAHRPVWSPLRYKYASSTE